MAKRQKHKKNKARQKAVTPQSGTGESSLKKTRRRVWQAVVAIGVVGSLIAVAYSFAPNVSVSPYLVIDAEYPFSNSFKVSNNSWLRITSVSYPCRIEVVNLSNFIQYASGDPKGPGGLFLVNELDKVAQLAPNETHDISCPIAMVIMKHPDNPKLVKADISIVVSFNYLLLPWRTQKFFCFETLFDKQNNLNWKSKPCSRLLFYG